jgi:hypothetical protein
VYNTAASWSTAPNSQLNQSAATDTSLLVQTLTTATAGSNPLIHQYHPAATTKGLGLQVTGEGVMRWIIQADGSQAWGPGNASRDSTWGRLAPGVLGTKDADLAVAAPGKGLRIAEGVNAKMGVATLAGTTPVKISSTAVTLKSRIFLTCQQAAGTGTGIAHVVDRVAGDSFRIAGSAGDTSLVAWLIVEPA